MVRKKKRKMSEKAIKGLLKSKKTPPQLKAYWRKKIKK